MANDEHRPVVLVVLDGWGYRKEREGNAIRLAEVPTWDRVWSRAPRTLLNASGLAVGLPDGQMGNSEVGHLNLGAGRVVMQDLVRIDLAIHDGSFFDIGAFRDACAHVRRTGGTLHLMGLIGDGGVHAVDRHLFALFDLAERQRVPRTALHALLDGRDTLPKSALGFMEETIQRAAGRAFVASLGGRYFGMDRDKRWDRTQLW
jgi:2,3-bisphosphoglycerate-independent phosphoglycerate mutase